ncbi:hypothetical protein S245_034749 [Arachis hypogaea]
MVVLTTSREHLLSAESKGLLCRDISPAGFRFYINLTLEIAKQVKRRAEVASQKMPRSTFNVEFDAANAT